MSGKHLLDTNIVIALFKNEVQVRDQFANAAEVFVSSVVIGELFYGALHSGRVQQHLSQVREFAARVPVLPCDATTAEHYGEIKNVLRAKGRPLPENDVWIAAIAKQHGLTVVTRDQHFNEIDSLVLEAW